MTPMDRRTFLLAGLALGTGAMAAGADPPPTLFQQVIPNPTGQNGYEELVAAVDELRGSKLFLQAEAQSAGPGFSLSLRRQVLADPPARRALALLQRGLGKPIASPRTALTVETPLPDLAGFRQLARLLDMQQHVLLADGRVAEALATLRIGLRLGQVVQTDTLISGLVGVAIAAIVIRSVGEHLEQLAARDCVTLYDVCQEWLGQPSLLVPMVEAEHRGGKNALAEAMTNPKLLDEMASPTADDGGAGAHQLKAEIADLQRSPDQLAAMQADAEKQLDDYYQRVLDECRKPSWQRAWPAPPAGGSVAARLVALVALAAANVAQVGSKYTAEEAKIRLLAVHGAVLAYRWEHDLAPPALAALNLGDLVLDSFTGQPLPYQATGRSYRLASAGEPGGPPVSVTPG